MTKENIYKSVSEIYGSKAQIIVAIEEMSELIQALTKHLRTDLVTDNLAEEIADVEIMIEQLRTIFVELNDKINSFKNAKIERLEKKINNN